MAAYSSRLMLERWRQETHEFKASHIYICRTREMAQFVKCRLSKHKDSSLIPSIQVKNWVWPAYACTPSMGDTETVFLVLARQSSQIDKLPVSGRPCHKK